MMFEFGSKLASCLSLISDTVPRLCEQQPQTTVRCMYQQSISYQRRSLHKDHQQQHLDRKSAELVRTLNLSICGVAIVQSQEVVLQTKFKQSSHRTRKVLRLCLFVGSYTTTAAAAGTLTTTVNDDGTYWITKIYQPNTEFCGESRIFVNETS